MSLVIEAVESEELTGIQSDVWRIAWPSVLTFALMTTNSIMDRAFVGRLGRDALAAVGVGGQILFLLVSLSMAITVGTTALVARFTGAQEPDDARRATGQSAALGLWIGLLSTVLIFLLLPWLTTAMGLSHRTKELCQLYLNYALASSPILFLVAVLGAAVRGLGDTRTPLKVIIVANIVHIVGDWGLIFGHLGLPRLGLAGAGLALSFSQVVAVAVYAWLIRRTSLAGSLAVWNLRLTGVWARRILKIGIPAAVTALLRVTSLMSFTGVIARTAEGVAGVAALPIGLTAESIAFMPGFGYSVAASALVGQALGAGSSARAERYGWAASWQAVAVMSFMGVIFFLAAHPFAALFTPDIAVQNLAASYLRIMAISEPMLAFGMVLTGALQGAGDTVRPGIVTAITFWGFRLPAAWYLAIKLQWNTPGAWITMSATTILSGLFSIWLFKNGAWKDVAV